MANYYWINDKVFIDTSKVLEFHLIVMDLRIRWHCHFARVGKSVEVRGVCGWANWCSNRSDHEVSQLAGAVFFCPKSTYPGFAVRNGFVSRKQSHPILITTYDFVAFASSFYLFHCDRLSLIDCLSRAQAKVLLVFQSHFFLALVFHPPAFRQVHANFITLVEPLLWGIKLASTISATLFVLYRLCGMAILATNLWSWCLRAGSCELVCKKSLHLYLSELFALDVAIVFAI